MDRNGNRRTKTVGPDSYVYAHDRTDELVSVTRNGGSGQSFAYDAYGNLTADAQTACSQSTLDDVLAFELAGTLGPRRDVEEVVNYVKAMEYGLQRLTTLQLSLRLIREIHGELLSSGRGVERMPGDFRTSQNWIGSSGGLLRDATYVPPPPHEMQEGLGNLETFLHADHGFPPLIESALAHAQFETIHPFLDSNGRVGRLLVSFLLVHRGVLSRPLLYLSYYLKRHRASYYDRPMSLREDGDWEGWVRFP